VASQTAGALGRLMGSMMVSTGNTLDDVVRELLKPMLKEWLDANLSQLVEAEVAKEIDRIRRMSR
jgi:cell pole-organizing protein PopZ